MNVSERVRQFVVENFYVPDPAEIQEETSLVTTGVIDSTGMLEMIAFLEQEFGIRIADHEMTPANLESIARIDAFVAQKKRAP